MIDSLARITEGSNEDLMPKEHVPVMVEEVVQYLQPQVNGTYVDATLGLGGHAEAILQRIGIRGRLVGIDRDEHSLLMARRNLTGYEHQCQFVHESFRNIDKVLKEQHLDKVNGILLDLGISSFQLEDESRGFSFQKEGPLDMRMNQQSRITAYDLINSLSEHEIAKILREYGEERWHLRIARNIVRQRALSPIRTTDDLKQIVVKSMPPHQRHQKIHPATRTFQAFRIAVNRELEEVETAIDKCMEHLAPGGRLVVISFHSLEDRIVKQKFRLFARMGLARMLTKKPLRPQEEEIEQNSRARSARLRAVERL
ncbi:MAG TPA: 16S rRNA (cytosine(1402)-N(4))-methyltransferase RsmH [Candidatus Omnitrophota bacterium]|nr:16S rRNA (cytosine(1402)-N(4))-methyltransferase RsmH [Candidatus Omnitrophota bacterium]